MRYFLISYVLTGGYVEATFGELTICLQTFPSRKYITESIKHTVRKKTILNIFEFKNEEDYNNYLSI